MWDFALLPVLFVPHAPRGLQRGTIEAHGAPVMCPRRQQAYQLPAGVANQAGQRLRQLGEPALPGTARGKPALFQQQRT